MFNLDITQPEGRDVHIASQMTTLDLAMVDSFGHMDSFGHESISVHGHSKSSSIRKQESHTDNKKHSEDWEKDTHEQLGSRHGKLEFNTIAIHGSSQQHFGDTTFHGQVRSSTGFAR